jgi:F0F1-type ATP synthase membrane subunit b/b'
MPKSEAAIRAQIRAAQQKAEREAKRVVDKAVREFDAEVRKAQRNLREL